ncbi:hypothetical protein B0A50_08700 [Salinomyces thailandicus]|uniref:IBR domain-containing protein n=1 Tax=Salinomyces thailandicus TaxID=706561 RepID=A0A4V5N2Z7_9PEZI|nr:hypothetical protein B0A50_08700 [Salinomyces thailandica]
MAETTADWEQVLNDADDETVALLIKLSLEDLNTLAEQQAGTADGPPPDQVIVREQWATMLRLYSGRRGLATPPSSQPPVECSVCNEVRPVDDSYQAPCGHWYCDGCLNDLFHAATTDESLYPPRCCRQRMPYDDLASHLFTRARLAFEGKREELDDQSRVYCRDPTCSTYIARAHRADDVAVCPKCETEVCVNCKNEPHSGVCTEQEAIQVTLGLAAEEVVAAALTSVTSAAQLGKPATVRNGTKTAC